VGAALAVHAPVFVAIFCMATITGGIALAGIAIGSRAPALATRTFAKEEVTFL
jgi:hypothetical protein